MDEGDEPQEIGVISVSFGAVCEGPELIHFDETENPENGFEAEREVEKVERKQTETINVECGRVHVMLAKFRRIRL